MGENSERGLRFIDKSSGSDASELVGVLSQITGYNGSGHDPLPLYWYCNWSGLPVFSPHTPISHEKSILCFLLAFCTDVSFMPWHLSGTCGLLLAEGYVPFPVYRSPLR